MHIPLPHKQVVQIIVCAELYAADGADVPKLFQGITFNLVITSVHRRDSHAYPTNRSHIGHIGHIGHRESNNAPLHMISIQTTVSRYPDSHGQVEGPDSESSHTRKREDNVEVVEVGSERTDVKRPEWIAR